MNPSLRQLRAFVLVAQYGSFTRAAVQMHLTQSALSVLVRELERDLGVILFDRHTRRVTLTEAGTELLPTVQRILGDLHTALTEVGKLRELRRGMLRVAAPPLMAYVLLPKILAQYRQRHPGIDIKVVDTVPEALLDVVKRGDVDIAVGPDDGGEHASVIRQPLFRDRHWLVCPPDHKLVHRGCVTWKDLRDIPFISPTHDFLRRLLPQLDLAGRQVLEQCQMEVSYMTTAIGMVAAGLGLTACPTYAADWVAASGLRMVPIEAPVFYREVCLYSINGRSASSATSAFVDLLRGHVRRMGGYTRTSVNRLSAIVPADTEPVGAFAYKKGM
ncbi:LysR family transcriptional regulator [Pusillimonas sp.]|uniref:LysR family transcriptional regulator n=1 Tax=Pusillimonas sp. TaxID=3040095 RepID=UPI0037CCC2E4